MCSVFGGDGINGEGRKVKLLIGLRLSTKSRTVISVGHVSGLRAFSLGFSGTNTLNNINVIVLRSASLYGVYGDFVRAKLFNQEANNILN